MSSEPLKTPVPFLANLEQLRHYRAGEREIDLLAEILNDEIAKAAEERTGRGAEEILAVCRLVIGDFQYLASWSVLWPSRFAKAEDQFTVRLLLLLAWWYSTPPNRDTETNRALESVSAEIERFRLNRKLEGERRRRQAGGRGAAISDNRTANRQAVLRDWSALIQKPKRDRAAIIAERLGITAGQVRRLVKKAGLR